jgi:uncharacterized protein (TIGR02301 family)
MVTSHRRQIRWAALAAVAFLAPRESYGQQPSTVQAEPRPAPPFESLVELAGVLGEAHAARSACAGEDDQTWRGYMQQMLDLEGPSGSGRGALTSAFNQGYRRQIRMTPSCTPDTRAQEAEIAARGRALSDRIARDYLG